MVINEVDSDIVTGPLDAISGAQLDTFCTIGIDCMIPLHLGMVFSEPLCDDLVMEV